MSQAPRNPNQIDSIVRALLSTQDEDITCGDCYEQVDQYVDMLRAGKDPAVVLPDVKEHLEKCRCCEAEFKALIAILEAATEPEATDNTQA